MSPRSLVEQLKGGLDAPICLTWELTYACNLACVHCLSSSGRRDPRELTTAEAKAVLDELQRLQVFYINLGGGEPMIRKDFFELVDVRRRPRHRRQVLDQRHVPRRRGRPPAGGDGLPRRPDQPRRRRRRDQRPRARRRLLRHGAAGDGPPRRRRVRAVQDLRRRHPPQRRPARRLQGAGRLATAPSCASPACARRAAAPTRGTSCTRRTTSSCQIYRWLLAHGDDVLTGDSFFHLNALGEPLPGLNMCGAGRVVCLIDPIGDVYACPFVIHDEFKAGSVRDPGGFTAIWRESELFRVAARAAVGRGVRQLRQLRRLPGRVHGGQVLHRAAARRPRPGVRQRPRRGAARRRRRRHARRARRWTTPAGRPPARSRSSAADPPECSATGPDVGSQRLGWRPAPARTAPLGPRTAPNRILFGPHVTNLGDDDRRFTAPPHRLLRAPGPRRLRHDRRRGRQRPRVRLAVRAGAARRAGRRRAGPAIAAACRPHGALVIASLDHAGGQGSSAYSQAPLWAPSRVPEVASPRGPEVDGGRRHRRRRRRLRRRRRGRPSRPGATASRSTPASTASCASSCPG